MGRFARQFRHGERVAAVGVDDHARHGYAHTALLARTLRSSDIKPYFGRLRAGNSDTYSGQSYQYRLLHPRRFTYHPFPEKEVILVDDVMTTGLTLTQAAETLHRHGKTVLFCLTLAHAGKHT